MRVRCPNCRKSVVNPQFNLGCAQWCASADKCLGGAGLGTGETLRRVLDGRLAQILQAEPLRVKEIRAKMDRVEAESVTRKVDPLPALIAEAVRGAFAPEQASEADSFLHMLSQELDFPLDAVEKARQIINEN